jgi:RecB family exonuclease
MQLPLEGMPTPLYPATPARLATYLDCPRRYRFGYLDRPAPPRGAPWAHNSMGAAVHTALARWWQLPREQRTPTAGGRLVVDAWLTDGFRDERQALDARQRARTYVELYLSHVDPDEVPVAVERSMSVRTEHASLWGRLDRLDDRAGEGLVVVDYKTGRSVLSVEDARSSLALAVYAAAASRTLRRACRRVELHHLPSGEVLAWEHSDDSLEEHLRRADEVAAVLADLDDRFRTGMPDAQADEAFPARVAPRCGWCDFRAVCDPGRSVPPRRPWDGLAEPG